jgi:signal transduction histidine kinase
MNSALSEFLVRHRELIERRTSEVFLARSAPTPTESEWRRGVPIFMEHLIEILDRGDVAETATDFGRRLFGLGFTVSELVHGYGSVCEVVTKLAREVGEDIGTSDLEVFNRVLYVAMAESVTAHERERTAALAHELRNVLYAATVSLEVMKKGIETGGSTSDALDRSLTLMGTLIDRSLAEAPLQAEAAPSAERFRLADAVDQIRETVRREVENRDLELGVEVDRELEVEADRQFLMSVVSNLVQNALQYTRRGSRVSLRARCTDGRLVVEVEDECGGLPPGKVDEVFLPFVRGRASRPGAGLTLSIAKRAIEDINGELRVRDLPGKGCVFIVELPVP